MLKKAELLWTRLMLWRGMDNYNCSIKAKCVGLIIINNNNNKGHWMWLNSSIRDRRVVINRWDNLIFCSIRMRNNNNRRRDSCIQLNNNNNKTNYKTHYNTNYKDRNNHPLMIINQLPLYNPKSPHPQHNPPNHPNAYRYNNTPTPPQSLSSPHPSTPNNPTPL